MRLGELRSRRMKTAVKSPGSAIFCHLVDLACHHRKTIKWDPLKMTFADPPAIQSGSPATIGPGGRYDPENQN